LPADIVWKHKAPVTASREEGTQSIAGHIMVQNGHFMVQVTLLLLLLLLLCLES
jgi:hypothetical protein